MADLSHAVLTRMIWIDARLIVAGTIGRQDLVTAFGISQSQAAIDFRSYRTMNHDRLIHDRQAHIYRAAPGLLPAYPTALRMSVIHAVRMVMDLITNSSQPAKPAPNCARCEDMRFLDSHVILEQCLDCNPEIPK
ncbi:hypothetical protein M3484_03745 [Pseudomonas sp. GX19020]|uniref:hypothetical protein n=1 Tax=Pseudomonas sp. GX19020 TaxID=2942277 RepID=UPI002019117B|nr:hypothetical protein [Pseudomonas sp. GX19020]MCL4065681.1 hypothetical protein [Pseudomonas sp. GX19020]